MRKLLFAGIAAIGLGVAVQSHASPAIATPIPDSSVGMPIQQAYWAYGPYGRYWVEPHHYRHYRRGWVDRWGRWHP